MEPGSLALLLREADDEDTSPARLACLAESEHDLLRESVAENPSTPKLALSQLAHDHNLDVVWCVAENDSTPLATLKMLMEHPDARVTHMASESFAHRKANGMLTLTRRKKPEEYGTNAQHGTPSAYLYRTYGCRCDPCTRAFQYYKKRERAAYHNKKSAQLAS